ncbi:MAG: right-handed parallel beta-helix repeat-containing protein, partial [Anaerolineae bacterium]
AGIAVVESPARVTNNTFANNQGDGVWFTKAEGVAVANNIIAGNTSDGIERYLNDTTSYTADYNDVFNNTLQNYRGLAAGGNDLSVNPKFVAAGPNLAEYYHLRPTSPVSAAGAISWAPEHDIDGDLRIAGGSVSMGADELPDAALAVSKSAEPGQYQAGAALTYTIRVTNTGGVTLTTTITDDLPGQVTPNNPVVWALVITPSQVWTKQIVVTVNAGYSGTLTNVVRAVAPQGASDEFTHAAQPVPTTPPGFPVYLPLIRR